MPQDAAELAMEQQQAYLGEEEDSGSASGGEVLERHRGLERSEET